MTKNWLKRVFDTLTNMELDDNLKLRMVTRLIDKSVTTWLDNLKLHTITLVTWDVFVREFNEHFYTQFHRDQKRQEFFRLRQFGKTITEYEIELRKLTEFVLQLSNSEEYLCFKFKEGLTLEIQEKMFISGDQSYKEIVQLALRVKNLTGERMS